MTWLTWHARDQLERPEDPYGTQSPKVNSVFNFATLVEVVLGTKDSDVTVSKRMFPLIGMRYANHSS